MKAINKTGYKKYWKLTQQVKKSPLFEFFSQILISYILHIPVPFEFCLEGDFSVSSRRIYHRSYHYRPQNVIHFYKILSDFPPPYRFCKVFISLSLAPFDHPLSARLIERSGFTLPYRSMGLESRTVSHRDPTAPKLASPNHHSV